MDKQQLAKMIDHTILKPEADKASIENRKRSCRTRTVIVDSGNSGGIENGTGSIRNG